MEPPDTSRLKILPAHQQVIEQIRRIHETIESDFKVGNVCASRRFDISYEQFCADPNAVIESLMAFLGSNECVVNRRARLPDMFTRQDTIRVDTELYEAMAKYARES